jgi:hypothetical protein
MHSGKAILSAATLGFVLAGTARANDYGTVVQKTAGMVGDAEVQALARKHGLQVMNVTWEDTAASRARASATTSAT